MNRRKAIGSMTAAAIAAPLALGADDEISDWVGWWERSKKYTLQIAEAMPENGYDFRPFQSAGAAADGVKSGDGARSFGELMQHIGQAEGFYLGRFGMGAAPMAPQNDTSKAATVKYLNELFDWSIGVVRAVDSPRRSDQNHSRAARGRGMTGLSAFVPNATVMYTAHTRGYSGHVSAKQEYQTTEIFGVALAGVTRLEVSTPHRNSRSSKPRFRLACRWAGADAVPRNRRIAETA